MIKTSKKLDELTSQLCDLYWNCNTDDYDLYDVLSKKSVYFLFDDGDLHDEIFEKGIELGIMSLKQRKPIYKTEIDCDEMWYFMGDLEQQIMPMLNVELRKMKKMAEEQKEAEVNAEVERLERELEDAEKRARELKRAIKK